MRAIGNCLLKCAQVLLAVGLIVVSSSEVDSSSPSPGNKPPDLSNPGISMNLNAGFDIPVKDIPALEEAALRGSGTSALKLAQFYGPLKQDSAKYLYWITVSAENGDPIGMHNLAYHLLYGKDVQERGFKLGHYQETKDRKDQIRARFWLERAAQAGSSHSRELLNELGNKGL